MAGLRRDIGYRFAHHGDKLSRDGIGYVVHEIPAKADATAFAHLDDLTIEAFEVDHFPVVPALGFRFRRAGRTVVFSGDTKWCESLLRASNDADMLVCEALNTDMLNVAIAGLRNIRPVTADVLTDVHDYHISTREVAKLAAQAGVKHLVLTHLIPAVPNEGPQAEAFPSGMADVFKGTLTMGRDLQRFSL
jgi:ribonuclease Z